MAYTAFINEATGEQSLALWPIVASPFQAQFLGPYTVVKQLSEQNYLLATPEHQKHHQLCHINLLKPHHASAEEQSAPVDGAHPVCVGNN